MTDLRFRNAGGTIDVKYKTNLLKSNENGIFTIMQIDGMDDSEEEMGFPTKEEESSIGEMITFAEENNLQLTRNDGKSVQTLVELPE